MSPHKPPWLLLYLAGLAMSPCFVARASAQICYARTVNMIAGAGLGRSSLTPNLPRDLVNHQNHPDDSNVLTNASPGTTEISRVTISTMEFDTGAAIRLPPFGNFAVIAAYAGRVALASSGRAEHQQLNDPRPPAQGSFVYTQLTTVAPEHAVRVGFGGCWRVSEDDDWWVEVEGLVDLGRWDLTFEKGWSRFSRDEPSLASTARGFLVTPQVKVTVITGIWGGYAGLSFPQNRLRHASPQLESHMASGWSFSLGARVLLPGRRIQARPPGTRAFNERGR